VLKAGRVNCKIREERSQARDPRAGFLPEMVAVQYRLRKDGRIYAMWVLLESEVGYVRRKLLRRHPDEKIPFLYQDGGPLSDEDPNLDWRTRTGGDSR
jgi:hypothetical protein